MCDGKVTKITAGRRFSSTVESDQSLFRQDPDPRMP